MQLYDYQLEAVYKLKNGSVLCGKTGTGKSITSLAYYFMKNGGYFDEDNYEPMTRYQDLYIITTARKRDTLDWEQEYSPLLLNTELYPCKVYVDSWNNIAKYKYVKNAFFIFDEQKASGYKKWGQTFVYIAKHNEWIMLSATPGDQWKDYISLFVANGFYDNKSDFERQHCIFNRWTSYKQITGYFNEGKLLRLRRSILVDMDVIKKTIPNHVDIYCKYDQDLYKKTMRERWNPFTNEPIKNANELCLVLRRIVNETRYKLEALNDIYVMHRRLIVFYNFDYELDYILHCGWFDNGEYVPEIAQWNGHVHEAIPKSKYWIYLVQYSACEGWNCVETDTIVFFSQNYSYRTMVQAAGRIDRANTPFRDLHYFHLKTNSPIDAAITRALRNKKDFNESAFVGDKFEKVTKDEQLSSA